MHGPRTWYIVLNGDGAHILHDLFAPHDAAHREKFMAAPDRTRRDTLSDRPTRSHASSGSGARAAVEPGSDPLREDKLSFLRSLFDSLEKDHRQGAFDRLVLIGAPEMIGLWREARPDWLTPLVHREIVKNLAHLTAPEMVSKVEALIAE